MRGAKWARPGEVVVLPSDRRDWPRDDMMRPVRLLVRLSLSTMSVIAVLAFWAAARRGREAMAAEGAEKCRRIGREQME